MTKQFTSLAGKNILLVEESPQTGREIASWLLSQRTEVTLDCSAKSAAEKIRENPNSFDWVLCDLPMASRSEQLEFVELLGEVDFKGPIIIGYPADRVSTPKLNLVSINFRLENLIAAIDDVESVDE